MTCTVIEITLVNILIFTQTVNLVQKWEILASNINSIFEQEAFNKGSQSKISWRRRYLFLFLLAEVTSSKCFFSQSNCLKNEQIDYPNSFFGEGFFRIVVLFELLVLLLEEPNPFNLFFLFLFFLIKT